MFFNALWIYGAAALLIFGMATRQPSLTVLATLLLLTAAVSWLWNRYALHGVSYRRRLSAGRVFRGETVRLECELVNRKLLPLAWIDVEDELPDRLGALDRRVTPAGSPTRDLLPYLTSLRPYERVRWATTLRCPHRGAYLIGPARLRSGDIFGFFRQEGRVEERQTLVVYPRVVPLPDLGIPPRHAFGDTRVPRALLTDPLRPVGTRDYRPEDSFRHLHWKATARAGSLQVKVFEPTTVTQVAIFLNLDSPAQPWLALDSAEFEEVISVAASLAAHGLEERQAVGVYSNRLIGGSNRTLRVPPGGGPAQLGRILESLAKLSPFATVDFPKQLRAETLRFPWGSTIVVVTAIMTPPLATTLEALRAAGHRLVLVATGGGAIVPPPVRGLITHRVNVPPPDGRGRPEWEDAGTTGVDEPVRIGSEGDE
ncbi:MAG: DUF58 domain-containing protein [Chloroflexota bacterium]|nr:DUF58 domain-containing protein [Chloroflexota bacterium]